MKNLVFKLFSQAFLLLACVALGNPPIQAQSHDDLLGNWKVSFNDTYPYLSSQVKNYYQGLDATKQAHFRANMEKNKFVLTNGGTLALHYAGQQKAGAWSYDANNKVLTVQVNQMGTLHYKVVSYSSTQLILHPQNVAGGYQLVLIKNN